MARLVFPFVRSFLLTAPIFLPPQNLSPEQNSRLLCLTLMARREVRGSVRSGAHPPQILKRLQKFRAQNPLPMPCIGFRLELAGAISNRGPPTRVAAAVMRARLVMEFL